MIIGFQKTHSLKIKYSDRFHCGDYKFFKLRSVISNLFIDIFSKYLSLNKTTCAFGKLGIQPGTETMFFSKLFRMDNKANKLESGSVSFFVLTLI